MIFFSTYRHYDRICSFGLAAKRLRSKPAVPCKDYVTPHAGFTEKAVEPRDSEPGLEGHVAGFEQGFCPFSAVTRDVYLSAFSPSASSSQQLSLLWGGNEFLHGKCLRQCLALSLRSITPSLS